MKRGVVQRCRIGWVVWVAALLIVSACGGGTAETTTTATTTASDETTTSTQAEESTTTAVAAEGEITFDGPAEVEAGTEFEVTWTGPDNPSDYITIVPAGADEGQYVSYFATISGPTGTLVAPLEEGDYELRYVDGITSATLASSAIVVTPYEITLEAPPEVAAGTEFDVTWTGPDGPSDYITIVPAGTDEGQYASYFATISGPTGTLVAGMEGGEYEIRYVSGLHSVTMAALTITVAPLQITLEAPSEVESGTEFEVTWTGPNGPSDYITIVLEGAPETDYLDYANTTEGSPLTLEAPAVDGNYEIRYVSGRVTRVFATIPIIVR